MNLALPAGPTAQAIGWALLHMVWQGALVALVLKLSLTLLAGRSANLRYVLSCAALALIVALGVATASRSYLARTGAPPTLASRVGSEPARFEPLVFVVHPGAVETLHPARLDAIARRANDALPAIVTFWLAGVGFFSLRLVVDWLRARRLVGRSAVRAREHWQAAARRLATALGIPRAVRLLESCAVSVPCVIGFLRPAILLPASALAGLSPPQLEMILAHELAHIRRHDFFVNLLQAVVETLLFYHPAVWWISRQVRIERENCCDDLALTVCGTPVQYARALARLEELRADGFPLAVSASGGSLYQRIRRIVGGSSRTTGPAVRGATALALLSFVLLAIAAPSFSSIARRNPAPKHTLPSLSESALTPGERSRATSAHTEEHLLEKTASPIDPVVVGDPGGSEPDVGAELQGDEPVEPGNASNNEGEKPTLEELIQLRNQNVSPAMVREMRSLFPNASLSEIASMAAVGATPQFVRELRAVGLEVPSASSAQSLAAVGVTPEYVRAIRAARVELHSADDAQGLAALGVTPEYIQELRSAGIPVRSADEARSLAGVGVTPAYLRDMRKAGVEFADVGEAQSLKALGVTPEFVRRLSAAGYRNLSVEQLQRLGAAGLTGDFVREMSRYRAR